MRCSGAGKPAGVHGLKHEIGRDKAALDASDHSPVLVVFELTGK